MNAHLQKYRPAKNPAAIKSRRGGVSWTDLLAFLFPGVAGDVMAATLIEVSALAVRFAIKLNKNVGLPGLDERGGKGASLGPGKLCAVINVLPVRRALGNRIHSGASSLGPIGSGSGGFGWCRDAAKSGGGLGCGGHILVRVGVCEVGCRLIGAALEVVLQKQSDVMRDGIFSSVSHQLKLLKELLFEAVSGFSEEDFFKGECDFIIAHVGDNNPSLGYVNKKISEL